MSIQESLDTEKRTGGRADLQRRLGLGGLVLVPLAYAGVLSFSLFFQFSGDLPCELCLMQRWSMLLTCAGPLYIVSRAERGMLTVPDVCRGLGATVVCAMLGALISLHHLTLTNLPGHTGFGPVFAGLRTYTWALVSFTVVLLFVAAYLVFMERLAPLGVRPEPWMRSVRWLFLAVAATITVLTVLQGGLHMEFHTFRYELLHDLGIA